MSEYKLAVIGFPVAQSVSPIIHGAFFETTGLRGQYERREIAPDQLQPGISAMLKEGFTGWNITIPHKEEMFRLCDEVSEQARRIGAVNTVKVVEDRLYGYNTDADGWWHSIAPALPPQPQKALVLGAGGAARAIIHALVNRGIAVTIANRSLPRAQDLANAFGCHAVTLEDANTRLQDADILVNTTSVGMAGAGELDIDLSRLPTHALVSDLIYKPARTTLLQRAEARGLHTVNGLGMLLEQARLAFKIWTGVDPGMPDGLQAKLEAGL